jgi:hypothetical protein
MKFWAAVPQEANFSLIGRFGNCLFGGAYGRGAPAIRGHWVRASAWWTSAADRARGDQAWAWGDPPALGLGGRHDLLLDQAEVPRQ